MEAVRAHTIRNETQALQAELGVRSETDESQCSGGGYLVDQDEIRTDVAVAEVAPGTVQRMVMVAGIE